MDLVLRNPAILGTFSKLGFKNADGYHINENCNDGLKTILHSILVEDKSHRPFRRSIGFGQNIQNDIIPLLISSKDDKTIELIIKILVNLTVPIECLLSLDEVAETDFGRHAIFEINNLLVSTKQLFTDHRVTKVVIEYLKKNADVEQSSKLSPEQCINISNCLLLLRNVLHIPEETRPARLTDATLHSVQNQILWNIFSQSFDKILIKLMTIPEAENWCVCMVQLIALVYKDQHVVNLHKLLNLWLETSLSESSEDNESNTSPPNRGSDDSSPILTSDPTSDSSDTGGSGKDVKPDADQWRAPSPKDASPPQADTKDHSPEKPANKELDNATATASTREDTKTKKKDNTNVSETKVTSEPSDCGYYTQKETQESISTSSNEDEQLAQKQDHQKPTNPKLRPNNKSRVPTLLEKKKKKIVKRAKATIMNVHGLAHKTPTDDDISHLLKEFTVDFLLKGYNSLVQTLHTQILSNRHLDIDTSHFFWLVAYFLKFATQIELDLELVSSILSFEIVSYLTAEAVNLCEQFELAIKLGGYDNKAFTRRLHLIVAAIREFILAVEVYKRRAQMSREDEAVLEALQEKMCETEELRSLFVLLLRHYNAKYQNKQYLQDLIVTNHNLLLLLEEIMKSPKLKSSACIQDHIKQFSTVEMMHQYGLMLEEFTSNGEFVNDCVFTLMHHVGGELNNVSALYQPKILRTFTNICDAEFEICDDWSDLVKFVINTFMKKPQEFVIPECSLFDGDTLLGARHHRRPAKRNVCKDAADDKKISANDDPPEETWSEDELLSLNWHYIQCESSVDMIGDIVKLFHEEAVTKSRASVLRSLYKHKYIKKHEYERLSKKENDERPKLSSRIQQTKQCDEIGKLCDQLIQDGRGKFLDWIQTLLLETCFAKIYNEKCRKLKESNRHEKDNPEVMNFELFKKKEEDSNFPLVSPVADHYLQLNESVPVVPWNSEQAAICKDLKFLQLLHKLGFQMPVDTGKVFLRIPFMWDAEYLYDLAGKIKPIETGKLKFSVKSLLTADKPGVFCGPAKWLGSAPPHQAPDNYQIHKQNHLAYMLNFTPMPMSSFSSENMAAIPYDEAKCQDWMEIIRRSQEYKMPINLKRGLMEECHEGISELPPCGASPFLTDLPAYAADRFLPDLARCSMEPFNPEVPGCGPDRFIPDPPKCGPARFIPDLPGCGASPFHPDMNCDSAMDVQPVDHCYDDHKAAELVASIPLYESDDNNSLCETASIASNLTRMYVSDEDEKSPDPMPRHPLLVQHLGFKLDGITESRLKDTPPF